MSLRLDHNLDSSTAFSWPRRATAATVTSPGGYFCMFPAHDHVGFSTDSAAGAVNPNDAASEAGSVSGHSAHEEGSDGDLNDRPEG